MRSDWLIAAVAGAALPLGFAPFDLFWLAPLSYAALFLVWRGAAAGRAFGLGFVFAFAGFLAGIHWIYVSVHDFGLLPVPTSVLMTVALPAGLALYYGAAGAVAALWLPTSGLAAWLGVFPALLVLAEWLRGFLLTGFGWLAPGYSQTQSWIMGFAPVTGLHGMTWAVLVCAGAVAALVAGGMLQRIVAAAVVAAVFGGGYALSTLQFTAPAGETRTVALVQGAVAQEEKWDAAQLPATIALYARLTREGHGQDLIVWPEAAIPELYERVAEPLEQIAREAEAQGSALMIGILRAHAPTSSFQNVVMAMTEPRAVYVKRHLVPFGEFYPVPELVRDWMKLMNLPTTDAAPGAADQPPLEIAGERVAVMICYEDLFGAEQLHYVPEATLLVNVSNDAWFGDSIAPHQHLQIARVRAAEVGRYMLRATNTGITAVIDPAGRTTAVLPQFEPGVLTSTVQGYRGTTPYARWGNTPIVMAALLVVALTAILRTMMPLETPFTRRRRS